MHLFQDTALFLMLDKFRHTIYAIKAIFKIYLFICVFSFGVKNDSGNESKYTPLIEHKSSFYTKVNTLKYKLYKVTFTRNKVTITWQKHIYSLNLDKLNIIRHFFVAEIKFILVTNNHV